MLFGAEFCIILRMDCKILVTDRCVLRKPKKEDAEPIFRNWANDPEVTKYMTWTPHESVEATKEIVGKWVAEEKDPSTVRFIITLKGNDEPQGSIDVVGYVDGAPEIGYCLSRRLWGQGLMTEVCKAFVQHLFGLGYQKVVIKAAVDNIGSNRVIQKCGFRFIKTERREHASPLKPEPVTLNLYELTK